MDAFNDRKVAQQVAGVRQRTQDKITIPNKQTTVSFQILGHLAVTRLHIPSSYLDRCEYSPYHRLEVRIGGF